MTDAAFTPDPQQTPPPAPPAPQETPIWTPQAEPERIDAEAPHYRAPAGLGLSEAFASAQLGDRLFGWIAADDRRAFADQQRRVFGDQAPPLLTREQANERYGIEGRLSFDRPVDENTAAWRYSTAQRAAFTEAVTSNTDAPWWQLMGAGFAGSLLDPVAAPLWLAPEFAAGRALRTGMAGRALSRMGPVGRGVVAGGVEGVAGGVLVEGANLWLHHEAADDYDFGQASANVLLGGLLGAGLGGVGGWWESRGAAPRAPAVVEALDEPGRMGAFAEAMEAVIEDRPVDLGPSLSRVAEARASGRAIPEELRQLDETGRGGPLSDDFATPGRRFDEALAVTPRGEEVPVRFAVVEADDLITSHDDDLFRNPEYPAALQPRQRDRAGAIARNRALEAELNPKRLIRDVGAETGAPIVARDGTVESGNGRTIAIRRSYRTGTEAAKRYRAELEAQGFDTTGVRNPVLVRERVSTLDGEARVKLTRDMNAEATEAYSPSERASADAGAIDDDLLGLIEGADMNAAGNRRFVRGFLDKVASDDLNRMTTADGRLSEAGLDRINAALVARAYGDRGLVEALFEATDNNIKAIGKALAEAAPEWAAMRAAMQRGEVPAELDPTEALKAAVAFVRHVRARKGSIEESMELIIGQSDAFSGSAMTVETEAFVRAFFRTSKEGDTLWRSPRSASSLAEGLRWLAGEARKAQPGPNLFGDVADESTGRQLLDGLGRWFARQGDEGHPLGDDLFRAGAAGNERAQPAPGDAGGDVRPPVLDGGRDAGRQGAGGEAAPGLEAQPFVSRETLWERTPDELEALLEETKASDQEKLVMALGEEGAAEFKRLDRKRNNTMDTARADEGDREFEARFGDDKLTDDQKRLIYGIGEVDATADEIKMVLDAHGDILPDDPAQWAAYMGAVGVRGATVEELLAVPRGQGSPKAQAAFLRLQAMGDYFAGKGVAPNDLPRLMANALVNQGGWLPEQASQIVGGFVDAMTAGRAPSPGAPVPALTAEKPRIPKGETPPPPKGQPFADPDIADLAADTAQMLAREGLEASPAQDPQTIADAVQAAAFCLRAGS